MAIPFAEGTAHEAVGGYRAWEAISDTAATNGKAVTTVIRPEHAFAVQPSQPAVANRLLARPVRPRGRRVGRNDPCPCGSGRKYKKCCLGRA